MKFQLFFITMLLLGLTGCSFSRIESNSFGDHEISQQETKVDAALEKTQEATQEAVQENTQVVEDVTPVQEAFTLVQSDITHYHDLIKDVNEETHSVDLTDANLQDLVNHLKAYSYNVTLNQIGEVTNPGALYALVNKLNQLPADYVPEDLVVPDVLFSFDDPSNEKRQLRSLAASGLESLFAAAKADGYDLFAVSGYRSYARQEVIYTYKVNSVGVDAADRVSARPGHSEHQSGLAMDISSSSVAYDLVYAFGTTPEGQWVAAHAHEHGFIIRYQEDKTDLTGYNYEPWHLRYVGTELATYIYDHNITLEELYSAILNQL